MKKRSYKKRQYNRVIESKKIPKIKRSLGRIAADIRCRLGLRQMDVAASMYKNKYTSASVLSRVESGESGLVQQLLALEVMGCDYEIRVKPPAFKPLEEE